MDCDPKHKVYICHANEGVKGYVRECVDKNSTAGGHGDHEGDVIPSYTYTVSECPTDISVYTKDHGECKSWVKVGNKWKYADKIEVEKTFSAQGDQSILENRCVVPTPTPTPTPTPSPSPETSPSPTPSSSPTPTPETSPTPTPSSIPTPTPDTRTVTRDFYSEPWCDGHITLHFTFTEKDGTGAVGKDVRFTYANESKEGKTDSEGKFRADFPFKGESEAKAYFDGTDMTTTVKAAENCPASTGSVLGATTGRVLGASSMASTGVFTDSLMNLLGISGSVVTMLGIKRYGKKN